MNLNAIYNKLRERSKAELPPANMALKTEKRNATSSEMRAIIDHVAGLGDAGQSALYAWIMNRANAYEQGPGAKWNLQELEYAACRDYLDWKK